MEPPNHRQIQPPPLAHDLGDPGRRPEDGQEILVREPLLLHAKSDRRDRIRFWDPHVLSLVRIDRGGEHLEGIALRCPRSCTMPQALDRLQRAGMVVGVADRPDVQGALVHGQIVSASMGSYSIGWTHEPPLLVRRHLGDARRTRCPGTGAVIRPRLAVATCVACTLLGMGCSPETARTARTSPSSDLADASPDAADASAILDAGVDVQLDASADAVPPCPDAACLATPVESASDLAADSGVPGDPSLAGVFRRPSHPDPLRTCDAISIGIGFEAVRGQLAAPAVHRLCLPTARRLGGRLRRIGRLPAGASLQRTGVPARRPGRGWLSSVARRHERTLRAGSRVP
jgi:hypothetical protein